jgi:anion-transporting  ArsA/GET3 family ATPase
LGGIGCAVVIVPPTDCAADSAVPTLLHKRLLFFVGKGGVGKTTIATAVALAFARQGEKTLLIEFDENTRAARLLGLPLLNERTDVPRRVSPTLFVLATSGQAALEEYLRLVIPIKRVLRTIVESRAYQYFVAAAPGLKELLTMGKVWYEERKREADTQQPLWDRLIVDLPATGHSLQYLRMPRAARDTFGSGVVHREAERILTLLYDADKTVVNLVTIPEELPVSETQHAHEQLVNDLCLPLGILFINRVHQAPLSRAVLARARVDPKTPATDQRLAEQVLAHARAQVALAEMQAVYLRQLQALSLPTIQVPFCFAEEFGLPEVEQLSRRLLITTQERKGEKGEKAKRESSLYP